ncbi:MAG: 7-carboxy-7-deazaguanine synthase QueE [Lentimicrobiaceae bacterium]|nr:7-carboxy-7-deazaguanine synthase QueE [Lentimicrobiaceae bacterium]
MENFYTIQGEGFHAGMPSYFVRLGGCDVGCYWCDVKESWNASLHPLTNTDEIIKRAIDCPSRAVVVTGGEPLQYNLDHLCKRLNNNNILTFLETSGSYPLSGTWNWICLSPKQQQPPLSEIFSIANELKVIIYSADDFTWAETNAAKVSERCHLFLQPEWSRRNEMMPLMVDYVMQHPRWNISLQIHKYMRIP